MRIEIPSSGIIDVQRNQIVYVVTYYSVGLCAWSIVTRVDIMVLLLLLLLLSK